MSLARRLEGCSTAPLHPMGRLCVFAVAGGEGGDRPSLNQEARHAILAMGYLPQSLDELTAGLL